MSDGKQNGWRINVWEVDQGGSRCGIGEIEGEKDSGRSWPGAIDMFENGLTAHESAWRIKTEEQNERYRLVLIKYIERLNGIAQHFCSHIGSSSESSNTLRYLRRVQAEAKEKHSHTCHSAWGRVDPLEVDLPP